jgi:hypothetical protein
MAAQSKKRLMTSSTGVSLFFYLLLAFQEIVNIGLGPETTRETAEASPWRSRRLARARRTG